MLEGNAVSTGKLRHIAEGNARSKRVFLFPKQWFVKQTKCKHARRQLAQTSCNARFAHNNNYYNNYYLASS